MMNARLNRLADVGFEKTRRAVAALFLSVFILLYVMVSLNAPDGWALAFVALSGCYLVAFLGIVAEWFWGRWFAVGIGWSGVMVGVISLAMVGWSIPLAMYAGFHTMVVALMQGRKMASLYDGQEAWRIRFKMDEFGVARLQKTVTRASASLPGLVLWALAPKTPEQTVTWVTGLTLVAGLSGLMGVLRGRTWGLVALGGVGMAMGIFAVFPGAGFPAADDFLMGTASLTSFVKLGSVPVITGAWLVLAVLPFAGPICAFVRRRSLA